MSNDADQPNILPAVEDDAAMQLPARAVNSAIERAKTATDMRVVAMTPAQARVDAVAALTSVALSKAATLELTPEETERLTAEFPDADFLPGAGGKDNLIYIQHSALRSRLNSVLGLGQWALVVRESWNEDFMTKGNPAKGLPPQAGVRVYVRAMMLVRGCYVAEAVGDMDYYPGNAAQNYGDAFEGAKTAAFRRCAKEFGVGVQSWDKHWCDGWWARKRGGRQNAPPASEAGQRNAPKPPEATKTPPATKAPSAASAPLTTAERRAKLAEALKGYEREADIVFLENALILDTESFTDISDFFLERIQPTHLMALIKEVKQRKWDSEQVPGKGNPDQQAEADELAGDAGQFTEWRTATVEAVTSKAGTNPKTGKPYTKYGIKLDGAWFNTFDTKFFDIAKENKGKQVRFTSEQNQYGHELTAIQPMEGT